MYDVWAKEKPKDDVWSFAYYLGSSAMRVCTNDVDENAWTKAVMGGEYKDVADFDGKYAAFDTCSQEQLIASCKFVETELMFFRLVQRYFKFELTCIFSLSKSKVMLIVCVAPIIAQRPATNY